MRRFYLSQFAGLGTPEDPFRPKLSSYGRAWSVDFRPDETKRDGWAIACLETDDDSPSVCDTGIFLLTDNPNAELHDEARDQIRRALKSTF